MRKLILLSIATLSFLIGYSQTNKDYYAPSSANSMFARVLPKNTLFLPTGCGAPSGTASLKSDTTNRAAIYVDSCNHRNYIYDPSTKTWSVIGTGSNSANSDSLNHQAAAYYLTRANHTGTQAQSTILNLPDSIAAVRAAGTAKLNITDAATIYMTISRSIDSMAQLQTRIQTKEPLLGFTPVPNTRTINGYALTSNITLNKSDVGLSNVPNTDATNASNISSGTLPDARLSSNVTVQGNSFNSANQLVKLDGSGKLPTSTIPSLALVETFVVGSQAAMLALSAQMGDVAVRTDNDKSYILQAEPASTLSNWVQLLTPSSEADPVYTASSWYSTTNNASNWNTAYSWGNHASAGYASTGASYSNPAWITSLAWSKITGAPSFLTTETDPIYTASSWYSTTNNAANWNTAYGWGNHASAGYALSSRTITINGVTYDLSANRSWSVGTITGGGTTGNIPQWSGTSALGNSPISISGSWIFTNEYTLVSNHTSAGSAAKNLALVDGNTGSGNSTAIYMGYNANGGDPYGTRIVQTGYPGSTRRGGFKFQSHGDASGDTDAYYYDLLTLESGGNSTLRGSFGLGNVPARNYAYSSTTHPGINLANRGDLFALSNAAVYLTSNIYYENDWYRGGYNSTPGVMIQLGAGDGSFSIYTIPSGTANTVATLTSVFNVSNTGVVTGNQFNGSGVGLTGVGSSFTAGAVSYIGGFANNVSSSIQSATIQAIIGQDVNNNIYRYNASALQTFLGLGTSAYLGISLDSELGYYFPSSGAGAYGYLKTAAFRDANQDLLTSSNVTFNQVTATILGSVGTNMGSGGVTSGSPVIIRLNIGGTYYYFSAVPNYSPPQP